MCASLRRAGALVAVRVASMALRVNLNCDLSCTLCYASACLQVESFVALTRGASRYRPFTSLAI